MQDVFEVAADLAGVPDDVREQVIERARSRVAEELAEEMHHALVYPESMPDAPS